MITEPNTDRDHTVVTYKRKYLATKRREEETPEKTEAVGVMRRI